MRWPALVELSPSWVWIGQSARSLRWWLKQAHLGIALAFLLVNVRRFCRPHFSSQQNELGVEAIASRFIYGIPGEISGQAILVIVVGPEHSPGAIRGKFALFIHHDEAGCAPRLTRLTHPAPHLVIDLVHATTNKVVARGFAANRLIGGGSPCGGGVDCFAACQREDAQWDEKE